MVIQPLKLFDHTIGVIVIATAVFDDVLALYMLATAHRILCEDLMLYVIALAMFKSVLILGAIYLLCRWLSHITMPADLGMLTLVIGLLLITLTGIILGGFLGLIHAINNGPSLLTNVSMALRGDVALVVAAPEYFQAHISHHMPVALNMVTSVQP